MNQLAIWIDFEDTCPDRVSFAYLDYGMSVFERFMTVFNRY